MDTLAELVASFDQRPANGPRIRELLRRDGAAFLADARPLLRETPVSDGFDYLLALLAENHLVIPLLLDCSLLTDERAISLGPRLLRADPSFTVELVRFAVLGSSESEPAPCSPSIRRALGIVAALGDCRRTAPLLMMLLRHSDAFVRSRAALLLGNITHNCAWAEQQLLGGDARVRANVVESLWGSTSDESRHVFRMASHDCNNRVAGNALLGLYQTGASDAVALIAAMAASEAAQFRSSAAWVMGRTEDPRFLACLQPMMSDPAPGVRRNVVRALSALHRAADAVEWLHTVTEPEGWDGERQTLRLSVSDQNMRAAGALPGTAFICWCGERLVADYTVSTTLLPRGSYRLSAVADATSWLRIEVFRKPPAATEGSAAH
jgi:hypothetical protein